MFSRFLDDTLSGLISLVFMSENLWNWADYTFEVLWRLKIRIYVDLSCTHVTDKVAVIVLVNFLDSVVLCHNCTFGFSWLQFWAPLKCSNFAAYKDIWLQNILWKFFILTFLMALINGVLLKFEALRISRGENSTQNLFPLNLDSKKICLNFSPSTRTSINKRANFQKIIKKNFEHFVKKYEKKLFNIFIKKLKRIWSKKKKSNES